MPKLLKIILIFLAVVFLAAAFWIVNNTEKLLSDLKTSIEKEMSLATGQSVSINAVEICYPLRSMILKDIIISDQEKQTASIDSLSITPNILKILKNRRFSGGVGIKNYEAENIRLDASLWVECAKARSWKEIFDFTSMETLKILKASLLWKENHFTNISGNLFLNKMHVDRGNFSAKYNNIPFSIEFDRIVGKPSDYHGRIKSNDIKAEGILSLAEKTLVLDSLEGSLLALDVSLKGRIENIDSDNKIFSFSGSVNGRFENVFKLLPENMPLSKVKDVTGPFSTSMELHFEEKDLYAASLKGTFFCPSLSMGKIETKNLKCQVSLENKFLNMPSLAFNVYDSDVSGNLSIDFNGEGFPVSFFIKTNGIDIDSPLESKIDHYGPLDISLFFKGLGKDLVSLSDIKIPKGEKLSLRKILDEKLLFLIKEKRIANMELKSGIKLRRLSLDNGCRLNYIISDLSLSGGKLNIVNMSFKAFEGSFSLKGEVDLLDENFPVSFDAVITEINSPALLKTILPPDVTIDHDGPLDMSLSFKGSGKDLAYLANVKTSKGEKVDLRKIVEEKLPFLIAEKKIANMELRGGIKLQRLSLDNGCRFDNITSGFSISEGKLNIANLALRAFNGSLRLRGAVDLLDGNFPASFEVVIIDMDSPSLLKNVLSPDVAAEGPINLTLSFTGAMKPFFEPNTIFEKIFLLKNSVLSSDLRLESLKFQKTALKNIHVMMNADMGSLVIPHFILNAYNGIISGKADMSLSNYMHPFKADLNFENIEPWDKKNVTGSLNADVFLKANGKDIADAIHHVNNKPQVQKLSIIEKLQAGIFYLSDYKDIKSNYVHAYLSSKKLIIGKAKIDDLTGELTLDRGRLVVPYINGAFYDGLFSADMSAYLEKIKYPFTMNGSLKKTDFGSLIHSVGDKKSLVTGKLDSSFKLRGDARNQETYTGDLEIIIYNANLGNMPIITPLLGNIYSAAQNIIPAFQKIIITSAIGSFNIRDRKFITKDLVLSGGDIFIFGDGYMDFDGNLNFTAENRILPPDTEKDEEWYTAVRNFVTNVGKVISKAHLKGTLSKPRWEMEYFSHIKNVVVDNVQTFFENLSR